MNFNIKNISQQIKYNCDISDAKYWGYFSLCGLLLRLRELYRSENNLPPWTKIDQQKIGDWITAKEILWAEIEDKSFINIEINGFSINPFEVVTINSLLTKNNLIYGAGYGLYKKPVFFLGELYSHSQRGEYDIYYIKKEFVRDLFTSSGMLLGKQIFIRLEQLLSILWEMFLESKCKYNDYLGNVFSKVGINTEDHITEDFATKLDNLALFYSEIIVNHELAEAEETNEEWRKIILHIEDRKLELILRNIKDVVADTSEIGPLRKIIEKKDIASLYFYISYTEMFNKSIHPELSKAFIIFKKTKDWDALDAIRRKLYVKGISTLRRILSAAEKGITTEEFLSIIKGRSNLL
ncbi:MAG: hypothetical protein N2511_01520 [Thermodesulfovibrionales bacterium]|nr:hypothetical protein [Thermodesulfovibrionales bacterium]